jgi:hypothetical protein
MCFWILATYICIFNYVKMNLNQKLQSAPPNPPEHPGNEKTRANRVNRRLLSKYPLLQTSHTDHIIVSHASNKLYELC